MNYLFTSFSYKQYKKTFFYFQYIHRRFPENIECLKFLVKISNDLGLKEANEYALELKKAERAREVRDNRVSSSRPGSRIGSSRASANNNNSRTGSAVSTISNIQIIRNMFFTENYSAYHCKCNKEKYVSVMKSISFLLYELLNYLRVVYIRIDRLKNLPSFLDFKIFFYE